MPAAAAGTSHHRAEPAHRVVALLGVLGAIFLVAWPAATFFKGWPGLLVPLELARVRLQARTSWWLSVAAFTGANTPTGLGGVHS